MADIAEEFVDYAKQHGLDFSPASRSALTRDFPDLQKLEHLTPQDRTALFDLIREEIVVTRGVAAPFQLHETDVYNASKRLSQRFSTRGMSFSPTAQSVIRDCCPFC